MSTTQATNSLKSAIETAWKSTLYNKPQLSPLLTAIHEVTLSISGDFASPADIRALRALSERIAHTTKRDHAPIAALRYSTAWEGEWHITNADLELWSRFCMWMGRSTESNDFDFLFSNVNRAISIKRLHQAYTRYHANGGLTKTHCILLSKMGWEIDCGRGDWISLHVQGKRPFGNSSIDYDIYEYAGWEKDWHEDEGMSPAQSEKAWDLFDELAFAATDSALRAASTFDQP